MDYLSSSPILDGNERPVPINHIPQHDSKNHWEAPTFSARRSWTNERVWAGFPLPTTQWLSRYCFLLKRQLLSQTMLLQRPHAGQVSFSPAALDLSGPFRFLGTENGRLVTCMWPECEDSVVATRNLHCKFTHWKHLSQQLPENKH